MQSHQDRPDHEASSLMEELRDRAEQLTEERSNLITAGDEKEDEKPLRSWKHRDMIVRQMPDDQQGVLRVSVGGNVGFGYCVFRGRREACRMLLRQALIAIDKQ